MLSLGIKVQEGPHTSNAEFSLVAASPVALGVAGEVSSTAAYLMRPAEQSDVESKLQIGGQLRCKSYDVKHLPSVVPVIAD